MNPCAQAHALGLTSSGLPVPPALSATGLFVGAAGVPPAFVTTPPCMQAMWLDHWILPIPHAYHECHAHLLSMHNRSFKGRQQSLPMIYVGYLDVLSGIFVTVPVCSASHNYCRTQNNAALYKEGGMPWLICSAEDTIQIVGSHH